MKEVHDITSIIDFLTSRKYPTALPQSFVRQRDEAARKHQESVKRTFPPSLSGGHSHHFGNQPAEKLIQPKPIPQAEADRRKLAADIQLTANSYATELSKLPLIDLEALFGSEMALQKAEREQAAIEHEKGLFFNLPGCEADYAHFCKLPFWTPDECTAIALGMDPRKVDWLKVFPHSQNTVFGRQYSEMRELIRRAIVAGQIFESTIPGVFIAWARSVGIELSNKLPEQATNDGISFMTWKQIYEDAKLKHQESTQVAQERYEALLAVAQELSNRLPGNASVGGIKRSGESLSTEIPEKQLEALSDTRALGLLRLGLAALNASLGLGLAVQIGSRVRSSLEHRFGTERETSIDCDDDLIREERLVENFTAEHLLQLSKNFSALAEKADEDDGDIVNATSISWRLLSGWLKAKEIVRRSRDKKVVEEAREHEALFFFHIKNLLRVLRGERHSSE